MTRYHSRFDRQRRILSACRKLLVDITNASDRAATTNSGERVPEAQCHYDTAKKIVKRIDREMKS